MFWKSAAEIRSELDSKWGLSKRQHACEYAKVCREAYRTAKVVHSPSYVSYKSYSLLFSSDDIIRELVLSVCNFLCLLSGSGGSSLSAHTIYCTLTMM